MRRCCGRRKMLRSRSKHVSSPQLIRPSSGHSSPARHRNVVVLPEPDGPKSTVSEEGLAGQRKLTRIDSPTGSCFSNCAISSAVKSPRLSAVENRHTTKPRRKHPPREGTYLR